MIKSRYFGCDQEKNFYPLLQTFPWHPASLALCWQNWGFGDPISQCGVLACYLVLYNTAFCPCCCCLAIRYQWGKDGKHASKLARSGAEEPLETWPLVIIHLTTRKWLNWSRVSKHQTSLTCTITCKHPFSTNLLRKLA